jgi:hypothetical protein
VIFSAAIGACIARAKEVGSLDDVAAPARLRSYLIEAVEHGMKRSVDGAEAHRRP